MRSRTAQGKEELSTLAKVMADPLRSRIFAAVVERADGVSIREISDRLDQPERRVRYHLDDFLASGLVGIAREEERRGARVRYYRAERLPVLWGRELPFSEDEAHQISMGALRFIMDDVSEAVRAGTFGRGDFHFEARIRQTMDRRGCEELAAIYERALEEAAKVVSDSAARVASGEVGIDVAASMLIFEPPST
jgi:DNA-binding transcriptional ArsR family regulator